MWQSGNWCCIVVSWRLRHNTGNNRESRPFRAEISEKRAFCLKGLQTIHVAAPIGNLHPLNRELIFQNRELNPPKRELPATTIRPPNRPQIAVRNAATEALSALLKMR
jgi:hypothetical protein